MPVKTVKSEQLSTDFRKYPIDDHGKLRMQHARVINTVDVASVGSVLELFDMPPGRVRVIPYLSRIRTTAMGAGRVLKLGHLAYVRNPAADDEPIDDDAFASGVDVSAASSSLLLTNGPFKFDMYSKAGIRVTATVTGGDVPVGAELELFLAYLYE